MTEAMKTNDLLAALADKEKGAGRVAAIWDQDVLVQQGPVAYAYAEEVGEKDAPLEIPSMESAMQMTAGVSGTGLAVQLLETAGADGQKEYLHVVSNHDTGVTLIVGDAHLSSQQEQDLQHNGIHYVQRGTGLAQAEVGSALNKVLGEAHDIPESNMPVERAVALAINIFQPGEVYERKQGVSGRPHFSVREIFKYPHQETMDPNRADLKITDEIRAQDRENLTTLLSDKDGFLAKSIAADSIVGVALPADLDLDKPIVTGKIKGSGNPYGDRSAQEPTSFVAKEEARRAASGQSQGQGRG